MGAGLNLLHRAETMRNRASPYRLCEVYMGGCRNYGPFLGTLNIRCRITIGSKKGP